MSKEKREILGQEIQKMIKDDIIEECESPWSAPVVMVPKPDKNYRVCIDYRKLNSITVPDRYPMPRIDELLHLEKRSLFMSTIDLRSGYYQISIKKEDRDKTAFVSPYGLHRFKRMPFGLRNAPATFQRLIDRFRTGLPHVIILAYLDDIVVISETFEQHLTDLAEVFKHLGKFKLRANRDKCVFFRDRIKFLGHIIDKNGIHPNPEKISAISEMREPKNVKQLKTFLQTASWYRKFIENFSEVARPLSNLTKLNVGWEWTETQKVAFNKLKMLLTNAPVLQQADVEKPFIIRTDASGYALGAVLLQEHGEHEYPIEFASRLLLPAERNYNTTEREALAVIWALNKFRGYIEGAKVSIGTDHRPLKWLMSLKSPSGRLARWILLIQNFNINFFYTPGKANVIADTLSRPPVEEIPIPSCAINSFRIDFPTRGPADIRNSQVEDEDILKIITSFETIDHPDLSNYIARGYIMEQGVLYRFIPDQDKEEAQLVIPNKDRPYILQRYHNDQTAGHYGIDRTISRILSKYYWPGIRKHITEYVKSCEECQKYKPSNLKPGGLLKIPVLQQRFNVIAIDLFGPLPETEDGYKWILIVEDVTSRFIEVFPLTSATAENCAKTLISEVFLRYGLPRRIISDNGVQFVSQIMQCTCEYFNIRQSLTPFYHPQANPVERKNRDLKTQLAIYVGNEHNKWKSLLPAIRFAMNTSKSEATQETPAFLTFGRELRGPADIEHDIRPIIESEIFIPEITPYLNKLQDKLKDVREVNEKVQDRRKTNADSTRRLTRPFKIGDLVLITTHSLSSASKGFTKKFAPRRDGPYKISKVISSTTYELQSNDNNNIIIGRYHISALTPFTEGKTSISTPTLPKRAQRISHKF